MNSRLHFLDAPRIIVGPGLASASTPAKTNKAATHVDACSAVWSRALFLKPNLNAVSRRRQDSDDALAQRQQRGGEYAVAGA